MPTNLALFGLRGRSISPGRLDRRSTSPAPPPQNPSTPGPDDILFPKVFEEAWGMADFDSRTDIERARIFLMRFGNMSPDPTIRSELRKIVSDQTNQTIPGLASAVQARLLGRRHTSFTTTPLLQCVRFMLIKGQVHTAVSSDHTKNLMDFFFDPVLARNTEPLPTDAVWYKYPAACLKVAIVGGGPTALASAISLAEKGAGKVEVHLWERRWVQMTGPDGRPYFDYPPIARRRDQVVTLQESVTSLMSEASRQALFAGRPERVWPGSANIQIRKVEDRLLRRCHAPEFEGIIHLHAEGVTREELSRVGDFHVLLGADGAASWVRKSYFHGYEHERGRSYALGLAFDRPAGLPWSQPLNMFLTLGQTRYLLNASDYDGRGYLNMQLTEEEWQKMVALDGEPVTFGHPGCLRKRDGTVPPGFTESQVFAPSEDRENPMWKSIEDGLKLFGFKEEEVINVVRIPIIVQAVREGVQYLPPAETHAINRPHALVAVAGDAAMTVHFWPGRGLNSGIKSGIALGDEIVHALNNGRFVGLPLDAMREYNDFILKLQDREHDKRSIPILNQSGSPETLGWLLGKAHTVPDEVAVEWLVGAMAQIAERLEQRPDWAFPPVANIEPQLRIVLRQLNSLTLREMAVSFPWPTREMGGAEVLPIRSMKPEEKQRWLGQLWNMLREERNRGLNRSRSPARTTAGNGEVRAARFEAPRKSSRPGAEASPPALLAEPQTPRSRSPSPSPASSSPDRAGTLRRSNATRTAVSVQDGRDLGVSGLGLSVNGQADGAGRRRAHSRNKSGFDGNLTVPGTEGQQVSPRSPSPGPAPDGEVQMGRLLSISRRPGKAMLSDALSLALFRVDLME